MFPDGSDNRQDCFDITTSEVQCAVLFDTINTLLSLYISPVELAIMFNASFHDSYRYCSAMLTHFSGIGMNTYKLVAHNMFGSDIFDFVYTWKCPRRGSTPQSKKYRPYQHEWNRVLMVSTLHLYSKPLCSKKEELSFGMCQWVLSLFDSH